MGKIFESFNHGLILELGGSQRIIFKPQTEKVKLPNGNEHIYGILDTSDPIVQARSGLQESGLEAAVMASKSFIRGKTSVGSAGIWLRETRIAAENKVAKRQTLAAAMRDMAEDDLRQWLALKKVTVPMEASKDQLVELAVAHQYGAAAAPAPAPAPQAPAVEPVAPVVSEPAAESPKPKRGK